MRAVPERAVCDSTIEDKDMKYRKINDTTVQCIISGEDMTEYGLALSDILERSQKGEEFLRDIIERAHEEVGYEIGTGNIAMQITPLKDNGLSITFTENSPAAIKDVLEHIKEVLQGIGAEVSQFGQKEQEGSGQAVTGKQEEQENRTTRMMMFASLHLAMRYAASIPSGISLKSHLYKADDAYYLILEKGKVSYKNFNRISAQAVEFGNLVAVSRERLQYLEEHGECLIAERAVSRLRKIYRA